MAAHNEACRSVGVVFIPLVVESLGGWNEEAVHNISKIRHLLGLRTGAPPSVYTHHLFQRLYSHLSVEKQRHNVVTEAPHPPSMGGWDHLTSLYYVHFIYYLFIYFVHNNYA